MMLLLYISIFVLLVIFSGFFSSAETALLSLNQIKLNLKAKKRDKKARVLMKILGDPEEFFSTILIGNNFVNIAAASISTAVFARLMTGNEELSLLVSTLVTTIIILIFSEVIPKSYAFRHNEQLSNLYAYPVRFFTIILYPLVKVTSALSGLLFSEDPVEGHDKHLTAEEIKYFLASQHTLVKYHPDSIRILNEIIDIAEKDVKSIMTPRLHLIAVEEHAGMDALKSIILERNISKIPVYKDTLDNITGIIHASDILQHLWDKELKQLNIKALQREPIFVSEYSSLDYVLKQFKKNRLNMAVVVDEYGATIGALTLYDIFSEILGELELGDTPIQSIKKNTYKIKGNTPVAEVNEHLHLSLPEKVEYATMSGLFVYYFGKFPKEKDKVVLGDAVLEVKKMGERKIVELMLVVS